MPLVERHLTGRDTGPHASCERQADCPGTMPSSPIRQLHATSALSVPVAAVLAPAPAPTRMLAQMLPAGQVIVPPVTARCAVARPNAERRQVPTSATSPSQHATVAMPRFRVVPPPAACATTGLPAMVGCGSVESRVMPLPSSMAPPIGMAPTFGMTGFSSAAQSALASLLPPARVQMLSSVLDGFFASEAQHASASQLRELAAELEAVHSDLVSQRAAMTRVVPARRADGDATALPKTSQIEDGCSRPTTPHQDVATAECKRASHVDAAVILSELWSHE